MRTEITYNGGQPLFIEIGYFDSEIRVSSFTSSEIRLSSSGSRIYVELNGSDLDVDQDGRLLGTIDSMDFFHSNTGIGTVAEIDFLSGIPFARFEDVSFLDDFTLLFDGDILFDARTATDGAILPAVVFADAPGPLTFLGSRFGDLVFGTANDDRIDPGLAQNGTDLLVGSGGNDIYDFSRANSAFGQGDYAVFYTEAPAGVTVRFDGEANTATVIKPGGEIDTFRDVARVIDPAGLEIYGAESFGDRFEIAGLGGGVLEIFPSGGDDAIVLRPTSADDRVVIGYNGSGLNGPTGPLVADLQTGRIAEDGFGGSDLIDARRVDGGRLVELLGTPFADQMVGSDFDDGFSPLGGDEVIDGRGGLRDLVRYDDVLMTSGVSVDLEAGTATGSYDDVAFSQTLVNLEHVWGTFLGDTIQGGAGDNVIRGRGGNDTVNGGLGVDTLIGDAGDDVLIDAAGRPLRIGPAGEEFWGDVILPGHHGGWGDTVQGNETLWEEGFGSFVSYEDAAGPNGYLFYFSLEFVRAEIGVIEDGVLRSIGGASDVLERVWAVRGTDFADEFFLTTPEGHVYMAVGGAGNDTITGTEADGDIAEYGEEDAVQGIVADLAAGTIRDDLGFTDIVSGIDVVDGTRFADVMRGDASGVELIGRMGDDRLLGGRGADTLDGGTGADIVHGDGLLPSHVSGQANAVFRLYQATLDRNPDATGYANWVHRLAEGERSLLEVTQAFVGSPEFQRDFGGLDDAAFVNLLYENVLGRPADAQGLARWTGDLADGVSRAQVVLGFSNSPEFVAGTSEAAIRFADRTDPTNWSDEVFRLYQATLDREPDAEGFARWNMSLANGWTLQELVFQFTNSREFRTKYGDLDDAAFVNLLYQNVLDRPADAQGLARWTQDLAAGVSRDEVVLGFSNSPEFVAGTADDLAAWMRAVAGAEDKAGADLIDGGAGDDMLSGGLGADTFRFRPDEAGADIVLDLEPWDILDFQAFDTGSDGADWVLARLTQTADGVVFEDGPVSVTFRDAGLADLSADMILA